MVLLIMRFDLVVLLGGRNLVSSCLFLVLLSFFFQRVHLLNVFAFIYTLVPILFEEKLHSLGCGYQNEGNMDQNHKPIHPNVIHAKFVPHFRIGNEISVTHGYVCQTEYADFIKSL